MADKMKLKQFLTPFPYLDFCILILFRHDDIITKVR